MQNEFHKHGGCLEAFRRSFPDAPSQWIDLSTGINPFHYPIPDISAKSWAALPEPLALNALKQAASSAYGAEASDIVVAPGAQSIIGLLPYLIAPKHVVIETPTYSGHAQSWQAAGFDCRFVANLSIVDIRQNSAYVLCRPNNPDGRIITSDVLGNLAGRIAMAQSTLIIDASFADLEDASLASLMDNPHVIILRSFGKAYGLGGLRLGFALGRNRIMARLESALGPWPVHHLAVETARRALPDIEWRRDIIAKLDCQVASLKLCASDIGLTYIGGTRLFSLFSHPHASSCWKLFARNGIATRRFAENPSWLRIGTPADDEAITRLALVRGSIGFSDNLRA